uniref:Uncharacterized protein n=1 Tax=Timema tahoe TaxID=61484 RepID=A0A7R9FEM9_9NEOP|nr:unnamed protein product [Timema tahoe]
MPLQPLRDAILRTQQQSGQLCYPFFLIDDPPQLLGLHAILLRGWFPTSHCVQRNAGAVYLVSCMTGKRTRSFKCAVHHRDREVSSENDFHILVQEPPVFRRMVRIIADEFLTEERDRKYYADHYTCCPPPLFIVLITLVESTGNVALRRIHNLLRVGGEDRKRHFFALVIINPFFCEGVVVEVSRWRCRGGGVAVEGVEVSRWRGWRCRGGGGVGVVFREGNVARYTYFKVRISSLAFLTRSRVGYSFNHNPAMVILVNLKLLKQYPQVDRGISLVLSARPLVLKPVGGESPAKHGARRDLSGGKSPLYEIYKQKTHNALLQENYTELNELISTSEQLSSWLSIGSIRSHSSRSNSKNLTMNVGRRRTRLASTNNYSRVENDRDPNHENLRRARLQTKSGMSVGRFIGERPILSFFECPLNISLRTSPPLRRIRMLGFFTYYTVAMGEINPSGPVPIDSVFIYRPDKRLEIWRFLFYMVLHAGEKSFEVKTTLGTPNRSLNPDYPVIGSPFYCESDALGHAATAAGAV